MPRNSKPAPTRHARGETSVREIGSGKWRARKYLGRHPGTGKPVNLDRYGATSTAALEKLDTALREWDGKSVIMPRRVGSMTLGVWLDTWLDNADLQPTTRVTYASLLNTWVKPYIGAVPLSDDELTIEVMQEWRKRIVRKGASPSTQQNALRRLRAALSVAIGRGLLKGINVATFVSAPPLPETDVPPPDSGKTAALLEAARGEWLEYTLPVLLGLGLRKGEVPALRWRDVNFADRTVTIGRHIQRTGNSGLLIMTGTKSHPTKTWTLPMIDAVYNALLAQRDLQAFQAKKKGKKWIGPAAGSPECPVFASTLGTTLEPIRLHTWFKRIAARAGQPEKRLHKMRHDCAGFMLDNGVPIEVVSKLMRHTNIGITLRYYAHLTEKLKYDALSVLNNVLQQRAGGT
jgi:integrase